jgi:hypothetical protein
MTVPVKVYLDAMTKYADAAERLAEDFATTSKRLYDADVTEDSFGMLPESRDTAEVYEQRTTDGLDGLKACEEIFSALGDVFRDIRRSYELTDRSLSQRMGGQ